MAIDSLCRLISSFFISTDLKLLLRLKDEEIRMLNRDVSKLSDRVSDYNEIEAHNTDLQSELFSRDRFDLLVLGSNTHVHVSDEIVLPFIMPFCTEEHPISDLLILYQDLSDQPSFRIL